MTVRIAVAAVAVGSTFSGLTLARIKRLAGPGQTIAECITVGGTESAIAHARLMSLLEEGPRPIALIGITIRPDDAAIAAFRAVGAAVVLIDEEAPGASTVACDNRLGGQLAAEHLVARGRSRFAVVLGHHNEAGDMNSILRLEGFERTLAASGLSLDPRDVLRVPDYSRKDGTTAMQTLLDEHRGVDAVFCAAGDVCAAGMLAVARQRGVRVPDEIAVVGFDDNALASISDPPLTTIAQPAEAIADQAFRLATVETAAVFATPRRILLPPALVVRGST
jgi:LacI family repressor for deo operon, udp, cdd, tsx, nupC, and nupG